MALVVTSLQWKTMLGARCLQPDLETIISNVSAVIAQEELGGSIHDLHLGVEMSRWGVRGVKRASLN